MTKAVLVSKRPEIIMVICYVDITGGIISFKAKNATGGNNESSKQ